MSEAIKKVDVEAIMEEIRKNIEARGYQKTDLRFADIEIGQKDGLELLGTSFKIDNLSQSIVQMDESKNVQCWRPLEGNPVEIFIKKVFRKCMKFYIEPIVADQNRYNHFTVNALAQVFSKIAEDRDSRIKELEVQVDLLSRKFDQLDAEKKGDI